MADNRFLVTIVKDDEPLKFTSMPLSLDEIEQLEGCLAPNACLDVQAFSDAESGLIDALLKLSTALENKDDE